MGVAATGAGSSARATLARGFPLQGAGGLWTPPRRTEGPGFFPGRGPTHRHWGSPCPHTFLYAVTMEAGDLGGSRVRWPVKAARAGSRRVSGKPFWAKRHRVVRWLGKADGGVGPAPMDITMVVQRASSLARSARRHVPREASVETPEEGWINDIGLQWAWSFDALIFATTRPGGRRTGGGGKWIFPGLFGNINGESPARYGDASKRMRLDGALPGSGPGFPEINHICAQNVETGPGFYFAKTTHGAASERVTERISPVCCDKRGGTRLPVWVKSSPPMVGDRPFSRSRRALHPSWIGKQRRSEGRPGAANALLRDSTRSWVLCRSD